jgi:hypothetical protein
MDCEHNKEKPHITYLYNKGHYVPAPTNPIVKKVMKVCDIEVNQTTCGRKLSPMYTAKYLSKQDHIYCYGCKVLIPIRCRLCLCDRTCPVGHFFCEECVECKVCTTCGACGAALGLVYQFPKRCCNCHNDIPRRCGNCMIHHICDCCKEYCKDCGVGCRRDAL